MLESCLEILDVVGVVGGLDTVELSEEGVHCAQPLSRVLEDEDADAANVVRFVVFEVPLHLCQFALVKEPAGHRPRL